MEAGRRKSQKRPNGTVPIEMASNQTVRSGQRSGSESGTVVGCGISMPAQGSWSTYRRKKRNAKNVSRM